MYNNLASVYDKLMEDMPYKEWADFIEKIIQKEDVKVEKILDLGSGTASISSLLSQKGYKLVNLDLSEEMLNQAKDKYKKADLKAIFVQKDIRDIEYVSEFNCAISTFDTMNYFIDQRELEEIFSKVYSSLEEKGLFLFDMNTLYKFEKILGDEIYTYNTEDIVYIWENNYNKNTEILEIDLSFFVKKEVDYYQRFNEYHVQRYYPQDIIIEMLEKVGFSSIKLYEDSEMKSTEEKGIRNFFAAFKS